jgi:hypothetical protein
MPCGVANARSKSGTVPACGRNEKIPPPSLLATTKTASTRSPRVSSNPF